MVGFPARTRAHTHTRADGRAIWSLVRRHAAQACVHTYAWQSEGMPWCCHLALGSWIPPKPRAQAKAGKSIGVHEEDELGSALDTLVTGGRRAWTFG